MDAQERLRQAIDHQARRLRADVPPNCPAAIVALVRTLDRPSPTAAPESLPDLTIGRHSTNIGGKRALQLCLEAPVGIAAPTAPDGGLAAWAERFLRECDHLAEAELILGQCETGSMRMVAATDETFAAWLATKHMPASWRERADIDWWAAWLARQHEPELQALRSLRPAQPDAVYRQLAALHLRAMAYQLAYPAEAPLGGCSVGTYCDVLGWLIGKALGKRDRGEEVAPRSERALIAAIASDLAIEPAIIERAVDAFTLDRENAAYHAAVPGAADAPLVRIAPGQVVWSVHGLITEPLFFLMRELRRRAAQEYHNVAHLREVVFRQDLYTLFQDKRFVTSTGRVELKRAAGDIRTDIDAIVFDRKSGTLGLFELKSQDPFARSAAERTRQRDNVLHANRQVSGVLDWLNRHGANEVLSRVDTRTARTFRAQKVYPFVLGRYLAHFTDGPAPDRRAAWGTWPQVLRLCDGQPFRAADANPIASLFSRLVKDAPLHHPFAGSPPREIPLGSTRLVVYPSYADFQASSVGGFATR